MVIDNNGILKEELHIMRKLVGLSQAGLARRLGISQAALSCYERGSALIPREISRQLHRHMCSDDSMATDKEYLVMREGCRIAFEAAEEAEMRLRLFWGGKIEKNWHCNDECGNYLHSV